MTKNPKNNWNCCNRKTCAWGFIIIGAIWLASATGLIHINNPIWPIVFIPFGVYILLNRNYFNCYNNTHLQSYT